MACSPATYKGHLKWGPPGVYASTRLLCWNCSLWKTHSSGIKSVSVGAESEGETEFSLAGISIHLHLTFLRTKGGG